MMPSYNWGFRSKSQPASFSFWWYAQKWLQSQYACPAWPAKNEWHDVFYWHKKVWTLACSAGQLIGNLHLPSCLACVVVPQLELGHTELLDLLPWPGRACFCVLFYQNQLNHVFFLSSFVEMKWKLPWNKLIGAHYYASISNPSVPFPTWMPDADLALGCCLLTSASWTQHLLTSF